MARMHVELKAAIVCIPYTAHVLLLIYRALQTLLSDALDYDYNTIHKKCFHSCALHCKHFRLIKVVKLIDVDQKL